jgi:hypothetical protein
MIRQRRPIVADRRSWLEPSPRPKQRRKEQPGDSPMQDVCHRVDSFKSNLRSSSFAIRFGEDTRLYSRGWDDQLEGVEQLA